MQTTVNLQAPFSYSGGYIILLIIILAGIIIYSIKLKKKKDLKIVPIVREVKDRNAIKAKYLYEIKKLEDQIINQFISDRKAYQTLSLLIRSFVYEITNIKVQHYTLIEIESLKIPILTELIKEYYIPEFSKQSRKDVKESLDKTRKVIEKWN